MAPSISVLICVSKIKLALFQKCLNSVLLQKYENFEVIIVDDGTGDDVRTYLDSIQDERLIRIRNTSNLGLTKSLNIGLSRCRGKYIARLDADDFSTEDRLSKQAHFLDTNVQYVMCGSAYDQIDEEGNLKKVPVPFAQDDSDIRKVLTVFNPFAHSTLMINKEALLNIGGYCEFFRYSQDYFMTMKLLRIGLGANLSEKLVCRTTSSEQISDKKYKQQLMYGFIIRMYGCLFFPVSFRTLVGFSKSSLALILPRQLKLALRKS